AVVDQITSGRWPGPEVALAPATAPASLAPHLVSLYGKEWAAWKWICLRGAGFPSNMIQSLASPLAAMAATELLESDAAFKRAIENTIVQVRKELACNPEESRRKELYRLLKR